MGGVDVKSAIRAKAHELGFDAVGFASAAADPQWRTRLDAFIAEGRHGTMEWMAERVDQRASPQGLWSEARTVIVLGTNYAPAHGAALAPADRATISVYAQGRDYHDTIKKRLKALGRWMGDTYGQPLKVFVDTAPVMEKPLAARAGIGWQGRHTNIVSRRFGSWLFLSEIYTPLELEPDPPEPDRCGSCRACEQACPTAALADGMIEPRRCISYLTIEHKGEIAPDLAAAMGNRVYGCDACMAACPWNKFAPPTREPDFLPRVELTMPRLADLAVLDDAAFREVFAGSPVKRIGIDRMARNVAVALANQGSVGGLDLGDAPTGHGDDDR